MAQHITDTCILQAPINDDKAGGLLIGITPKVTAAHITRAVLESLAFVIKLQYETMVTECKRDVNHIIRFICFTFDLCMLCI